MPEEAFILAFMSIAAGTFLVIFTILQITSYAKSKHKSDSGSLRTSELEAMLRRIVRDELRASTDPLAAKGGPKPLLEEHFDDEFGDEFNGEVGDLDLDETRVPSRSRPRVTRDR